MKLYKLKYRLIFLLCLVSTVAAHAQQKAGLFYQVTGNGLKDTSYIFGTYHLVNNSYLNEIPRVQKAFQKAKGVVVEIVLDSSKINEANAAGMMERKLTELLDQPFRDSLDAELKSAIGVGIEQLNNFKPMNVTLTLSVIYLMKNNKEMLKKYSGQPLDMYFAKTGSEQNKKITALETIDEQMNLLFNNTSIDEQLNGLKAFIRNKNAMVKIGDEMVNSWFANNLTKMNELYENTLDLSGEEDKLVKQRNLNWMKVLPGLINQQSQFIAVGALHLGGKSGIVELLRQKGYTVTAINTKM